MSRNFTSDYYQILEVDHSADRSTIEAQFHELMKQLELEPYKNFGRIQKLKEAYLVLGDELSRYEYDYWLNNPSQNQADDRIPSAKTRPAHPGYPTQSSNNTGIIFTVIFIIATIILAKHSALDTRDHNQSLTPAGTRQDGLSSVVMPPTGRIRSFVNGDLLAPFKVSGAPGVNYYIKLVDNDTNQTAVTLFLRTGETLQTKVPLGTYRMRTAEGQIWYDQETLFGPNTRFTVTTEPMEFYRSGFQVMGHVLSLQSHQDGNLQIEEISSEEF